MANYATMSDRELEESLAARARARQCELAVVQTHDGWEASFVQEGALGREALFTASATDRRSALIGLLQNDDLRSQAEGGPPTGLVR